MIVLVFAPHNDDEVLGCGGTLAKLASAGNSVVVCEVTSGNLKDEITTKIKNEALDAHKILGISKTIFLDLPVVELKNVKVSSINQTILNVVKDIKPDIVFIPFKGDMHIDHRIVADSVMVACRPFVNDNLKAIYAYETLSETEWNIGSVDNVFIPNVYSDISDFIDLKIQAMRCYQTQLLAFPHPRSLKSIEALALHRGSNICTNYAEAFMCVRMKI